MREYLLTLLIAAVLTYMCTPLVRSLALRSKAVASVRERDIHTQETPRWGGVAMWLAMGATLVMVGSLNLVGKAYSQELLGIFLASKVRLTIVRLVPTFLPILILIQAYPKFIIGIICCYTNIRKNLQFTKY